MSLISDREAKNWLTFVRDMGTEGIDALEFTLMQLALYDLHRQRDDIERFVKKEKSSKETAKKRLYRAIAKTYFATGMRPPDYVMKGRIRRQFWVDDYERQDGTPVQGHWRTLGEGQSPPPGARVRDHPDDVARAEREFDFEASEPGARERWRGVQETRDRLTAQEDQRDRQRRLDSGQATASELLEEQRRTRQMLDARGGEGGSSGFSWDGFEPDIQFTGLDLSGPKDDLAPYFEHSGDAVREYVKQENAAEGVKAVANFFANKPGRFQFALQAISKFGPFTGSRVAYNYFRYGGYDLPMQVRGDAVYTDLGDQIPAPESQENTRAWSIQRLMGRLPTMHSHRAEAEPPSEGFIIDASGNIVAHAVGRGNDHYLPFSMKHLRAMRNQNGVEYVRRRMYGGPTVEDFHIAMSMGVDRFTVVSNQGVFSVNLRTRAHGIKVEHFQIVERYAEILESTKLDFDGYRKAILAMRDEFPLHIGIGPGGIKTNRQEWVGIPDRIQGRDRLMDSLRKLFGIEDQQVEAKRQKNNQSGWSWSQGEQGRTTRDGNAIRRQHLPNIQPNESVQQYAQRMRRSNVSLSEIQKRVANFYSSQGQTIDNVGWARGFFNLDEDKQPSNMRQQASVRQPPAEFGEVQTRKVPKAETAPSKTQAENEFDIDDYPRAAGIISADLGLDPYSYEHTQSALDTVKALNKLSDDQLVELQMNADEDNPFYRQIVANFRPVSF